MPAIWDLMRISLGLGLTCLVVAEPRGGHVRGIGPPHHHEHPALLPGLTRCSATLLFARRLSGSGDRPPANEAGPSPLCSATSRWPRWMAPPEARRSAVSARPTRPTAAKSSRFAGVDLDVGEKRVRSRPVGTSGCGKSTLLSIVAGLETTDAGRRQRSTTSRPRRPASTAASSLPALHAAPWLTAEGNVAPRPRRRRRQARRRCATSPASSFLAPSSASDGFEGGLILNELSGGMKQSASPPRLARLPTGRGMLLDGSQAPSARSTRSPRHHMQELLTRIWERHRLTVLLHHPRRRGGRSTSDRVAVMSNRPGRIKTCWCRSTSRAPACRGLRAAADAGVPAPPPPLCSTPSARSRSRWPSLAARYF